MTKVLIAMLMLIFAASVAAQVEEGCVTPGPDDYPAIVETGKTVAEFIPKGFTVVKRVSGDLNGDGAADAAMIIQGTSKKFLNKNEGFGGPVFDTNPRILFILFKEKANAGFRVAARSNTFVVIPHSPVMTEPFLDMSIKKGVLSFLFEEFYSAGSWSMSNRTYKFRFEDGEFVLIGLDKTYTQRNTGEIETRSYNFLTGKVKTDVGMIDDSVKPKVTWRDFRLDPKMTLTTIPPPFTWEIESDYVV